MLGEAVIVAEAPQVTISEDTIGYNASAYRTPEGDVGRIGEKTSGSRNR